MAGRDRSALSLVIRRHNSLPRNDVFQAESVHLSTGHR